LYYGSQYLSPNDQKVLKISGLIIDKILNTSLGLESTGVPVSKNILLIFYNIGTKANDLCEL